MPASPHHAAPLLKKNAELTARLKVYEHSIDQLREQLTDLGALQAAYNQLQSEHSRTLERKVLLEEEVRFLKAQLYGRSSNESATADFSAIRLLPGSTPLASCRRASSRRSRAAFSDTSGYTPRESVLRVPPGRR